MNDLTVLYYTANRISPTFSAEVRGELLQAFSIAIGGMVPVDRLVSVSHGFLFNMGTIIDVGQDTPTSIWQVYRNILIGAKCATTPYVACCEDDSLYVPEHFTYRPALDTFAYNRHRWVLTRHRAADGRSRVAQFYYRDRTQMAQCIAPRELLIETLEERFAKYPTPVEHETAKKTGWGEPGRYEKNLGLTPRKLEYFWSVNPNVTFNHGASLMGRRKVNPGDQLKDDLPPWGNATELWNRVHG